ncbi:mpv17 pmp22 family protein, putative, partial [Ichthyophthirius multifiliis]
LQIYKFALIKYPYLSRMTTNGTITFLFDLLYQQFIEKNQKYNKNKLLIQFTVGFCSAPWGFLWFQKLQTTLLAQIQTNKQIFLKIVTDYLICFPIMQLIYYFSFNILYFKSFQTFTDIQMTKANFSLQNYHKSWPLFSLLNHIFIPFYLRPVFANIYVTSWNGYVNYIFIDKS